MKDLQVLAAVIQFLILFFIWRCTFGWGPFSANFLNACLKCMRWDTTLISKRLHTVFVWIECLCITHLLLITISDYSLHGFKESVRRQVAQHPGSEKTVGQVSDKTRLGSSFCNKVFIFTLTQLCNMWALSLELQQLLD